MGYRFRIHRNDLPGNPDIVLPRHRKVVLVHGCFWHRHEGCRRTTLPADNRNYWQAKFDATVMRDVENIRRLGQAGWEVLVLWECEATSTQKAEEKLRRFFGDGASVSLPTAAGREQEALG